MASGRILAGDGGGGGRVLGSPPSVIAGGRAAEAERPGLAQWLLLASLPLFGQSFHYVIDLPPLYYLSKAWPLLVFPLMVIGLTRVAPPYRLVFASALAYALVVAPAMSMVYLGNQLIDALATTVKAWPLGYYFAVLAAVTALKMPPRLLERGFLFYGVATWLLLWALWLLVPRGLYVSDPTASRLFLFDFERGHRIFLPLFFGIFALFYAAERFCRARRLPDALLVLFALLALPTIYKQRTHTAAVLLVLAWILFSQTRGVLRSLLLWTGAVLVAALVLLALGPFSGLVEERLGASLTIRLDALALASDFLVADPLRWILGVGSITRFSDVTLFDIFGTHHFYLADLGWAGILFEYGVMGTLLILGVYLAGLREALRAPGAEAPPVFEAALAHLALFLVLVTVIYPPMYAPGELATTLALLVYLRLRRGLLQAGRPATLG